MNLPRSAPAISVLMGVYNDAAVVGEAIDSLLRQTFADFELLVCDDGSIDGTLSILDAYRELDPRVIVLHNTSNLGLAATLNRCLDVARAPLVARMDSDDVAVENRFEIQVGYLRQHPEVSVVGGSALLFDERGEYGVRHSGDGEFSRWSAFKHSYFIHPSVMIRREALVAVGGYTEGERTVRAEDYDLWCKFAEGEFEGYNMPEVVIRYRQGRDAYKKRRYRHRVSVMRLKMYWRRRLGLPWYMDAWAVLPVMIGLVPSSAKKLLDNSFARIRLQAPRKNRLGE